GLGFLIGIAALVELNTPEGKAGDFVWDAITFTVAWIVGFAVGEKYREVDEAKERAAIAEREREERALRAVAEERTRIARELHDVVGHSVSVMTVQASAVRRRLDQDQERVSEALQVVEQTGREAQATGRATASSACVSASTSTAASSRQGRTQKVDFAFVPDSRSRDGDVDRDLSVLRRRGIDGAASQAS